MRHALRQGGRFVSQGVLDVQQTLADMERDEKAVRDAAKVMARRAALEKARSARKKTAAARAARLVHVHTHNEEPCRFLISRKGTKTAAFYRRICSDNWTRDAFVVAPRAVGQSSLIEEKTTNACPVCLGWWAAWKLFGPGKAMTRRRFNAFKCKETSMAEMLRSVAENTAQSGTAKTGREIALEKALGLMYSADHPKKEPACAMLIALIQIEGDRRNGKPEVESTWIDGEEFTRDAGKLRRAMHVELVRMGLPPEVMNALRG